ncbi:MAG: pilus assembly protein [Actinobacteria bacterium]|nr:pilus assembly protein [Actinomycetota bacterium]
MNQFKIQNSRFKINNKGQALVEFALFIPILVLLAVAGIQIGIMFYSYISVEQLAREGAKYASVKSDKTDSEIAEYLLGDSSQNYTGGINPSQFYGGDFSISISPAYSGGILPETRRNGYTITVTLTYNLKGSRPKMFVPRSLFGVSIPTTVSSNSSMRID